MLADRGKPYKDLLPVITLFYNEERTLKSVL